MYKHIKKDKKNLRIIKRKIKLKEKFSFIFLLFTPIIFFFFFFKATIIKPLNWLDVWN